MDLPFDSDAPTSSSKHRDWVFILYPESAPDDWLQSLVDTHCPFAVSPLHDSDLDKEGLLKKPHYHIMLSFSGPRTFDFVRRITRSLNQPRPFPVLDKWGMFAYLDHSNDPSKFQYSHDDIQLFNDFSVPVCRFRGGQDIMNQELSLIYQFIFDNSLTEFSDLMRHFVSIGDVQSINLITNKAFAFTSLLSSIRHSNVSKRASEYAQQMQSDFPIQDMDTYEPTQEVIPDV